MKLENLSNFLKEENGHHTTNVYIPSIKREIPLRPLTTGNVKTITRISVFNEFDLNNELLKLSLFDKLSIEHDDSCGISSETITQMDYLSFLIGIRRLLDNTLSFSFKCQNCGQEFVHKIDLEEFFSNYIEKFQRRKLIYEKIDNNDNKWKFELESYTMKDYLYYRYYLEKFKEVDTNKIDVLNEPIFLRPVLYIRNIWRNDELIEDWKDQLLSAKIKILNSLPSEILIDVKNSGLPETCLSNFIKDNFDEERLFKEVDEMIISCTICGERYTKLFELTDFFYILGYAEDNQQIYMHILETECFLIFHRWFTLDQINNMSYLDFTIYGERISTMYEEDEKRKAEEKQQNYEAMASNFEALGELLVGSE